MRGGGGGGGAQRFPSWKQREPADKRECVSHALNCQSAPEANQELFLCDQCAPQKVRMMWQMLLTIPPCLNQ